MKLTTSGRGTRIIFFSVLCSLVMAGCQRSSGPVQFQVVFAAPVLNRGAITDYGLNLRNEIPSLTINGELPLFTPLQIGGDGNPEMVMATMMRFAGMTSSQAVDLLIVDMENANRFAHNNLFLPLSELFSPQELEPYEDLLLDFALSEVQDGAAVLSGEVTPVNGFDVTGHEALVPIFGNQRIGVFVLIMSRHPDLARQVLLSLL
ncbi:MAG: hypothetical protein FWH12_04365 [Treponema sp.]|nr:hypothetical protein [Treponema sp.]